MNRDLRISILKHFDTQSDFANHMGIHESKVSQIIKGRRKLSKDDAKKWAQILNCDPKILLSVTQARSKEGDDVKMS
jgi:plasmid maintenance system antidote protein VapI